MVSSGPSGCDSVQELVAALDARGLELPVSPGLEALAEPVPLGSVSAPNRFAIQPMEGCDCDPAGAPTELTRRRYRRFGGGGAGLIWFEACAVVPDGRANPHQMMLTDANVGEWARVVDETRRAGRQAMGAGHEPVCVLQLTHSGRFSQPEPVLGYHSPALDRWQGLSPEHPLITDGELDALQESFLAAARLAQRAGFDGVDVKACHGYLAAELLRAFPRTDSRYGGPAWENRTRLVRGTALRIADDLPAMMVTSRLNGWDPVDYPR
ncbi:MAG: NADH:flavin oxidoreductase, partial [Candidatus Brocadiia bacterium]